MLLKLTNNILRPHLLTALSFPVLFQAYYQSHALVHPYQNKSCDDYLDILFPQNIFLYKLPSLYSAHHSHNYEKTKHCSYYDQLQTAH